MWWLQYDNELPHYGSMDGHGSSIYDPHRGHTAMQASAALSHSPSFTHAPSATGLQNPYPNYSTPSSSMPGVMNSSSADSQIKRDKDSIYG